MTDFFLNLKSPGWWLGVVVVSFVINLAAAYAKPTIDRCLARLSDRRRKKLELANTDLERQAEITQRRPDGLVLLALEELTLVLAALFCTTFCILLLVFVALPFPTSFASEPPTGFLLFTPVLLILAIVCMRAAQKKSTLLKRLKTKRNEEQA
jgi:hypothetical protein